MFATHQKSEISKILENLSPIIYYYCSKKLLTQRIAAYSNRPTALSFQCVDRHYQYLASDLSSKYHITVYTPDLRGHGESGGKRGDTSSKEQVWVDISTMIDLVQKENPNLPVYLVGHSSGAGLLLNYLQCTNIYAS